jgi:Fe-S-cluster containining protein
MGLTHDINTIKQNYREIFQLAHKRFVELFERLHANYHCNQCNTSPTSIDSILHEGCGYREWQKDVIVTLERTIGKQIVDSLERIKQAREVKGSCHQCGVCCSLASSEFSYEELLAKAQNGDYFAQQFTSVFIPYESDEAAQARYPELVSEIVEQTGGDVHFYHCPYLSEDNRCTIYNDPRRPQICADYPETPLILMYKNCGYQPWKSEMMPTTLLAHASLELCQHYVNKIYEVLQASDEAMPTIGDGSVTT